MPGSDAYGDVRDMAFQLFVVPEPPALVLALVGLSLARLAVQLRRFGRRIR